MMGNRIKINRIEQYTVIDNDDDSVLLTTTDWDTAHAAAFPGEHEHDERSERPGPTDEQFDAIAAELVQPFRAMLDEHPMSTAYRSAMSTLMFTVGRRSGVDLMDDRDAFLLFAAVTEHLKISSSDAL